MFGTIVNPMQDTHSSSPWGKYMVDITVNPMGYHCPPHGEWGHIMRTFNEYCHSISIIMAVAIID